MTCPRCSRHLILWSDSTLGSFGWACETCLQFYPDIGRTSESVPVDSVPFPTQYRQTPRYRKMVGWCGP